MTSCTCDTHSASSNATVLTVDQTSASSTATQVAYFHSANGSQPYVIFAEGGTNSILGKTYTSTGTGVYGQAASSGTGVYGQSTSGIGVFGDGPGYGGTGVYGRAAGTNGVGVYGTGSTGVSAAGTTYGVYATGTQYAVYATGSGVYAAGGAVGIHATGWQYAGDFAGNVNVSGGIYKGGGGFLIDHPQDPENKHLYHCFVESPEMLNTYRGRVILDANGSASVTLPGYFSSACSNPDYQLTSVGEAMPNLHVSNEGTGSFVISGGVAGKSVCWTVVAARADKWAKNNFPGVEVEKSADKKGFYRHPECYGKDRSMNENKVVRDSKETEKK
jgi:hypothetical protein